MTCTAHVLHNCRKGAQLLCRCGQPHCTDEGSNVKNKSRRTLFDEIGSPPEPVVTRWGSWFNAAFYYADNLLEVQEIVSKAKEAINPKTNTASLQAGLQGFVKVNLWTGKYEMYNLRGAWRADLTRSLRGQSRHQALLEKEVDRECRPPRDRQHGEKQYLPSSICGAAAVSTNICCCERSFPMLRKLLAKDRYKYPPKN